MVRRSCLILYSGFPVGIRNITGNQSWSVFLRVWAMNLAVD